jgi:hypothetical protein
MTVNSNKLDVTLTAEGTAAVSASMASLYTAMPFLVSLTTTQIRQLPKLGDKSEAFVRQAHQIARDHPAALPLGLSVEQMDRDQAIRDLLLPVHQQLTQLLTMVNSTLTLAGSDLMKTSLIIYRALQSHGEEVGLKEIRDELARRFAKAPRPREEESAAAIRETSRRSE